MKGSGVDPIDPDLAFRLLSNIGFRLGSAFDPAPPTHGSLNLTGESDQLNLFRTEELNPHDTLAMVQTEVADGRSWTRTPTKKSACKDTTDRPSVTRNQIRRTGKRRGETCSTDDTSAAQLRGTRVIVRR
jgi:hypothetical protein